MSITHDEPPATSKVATAQPQAKKHKSAPPPTSLGGSSIGPKPLESQLFFRILGTLTKNLVKGYATPTEEVEKGMTSLKAALEKLQISKATFIPDVAYGAGSGDALIVLTPEAVLQYDILEFRDGLVAIAQRYNALSDRVKENARATPRMPVETVVSSRTELAVLRGMANLYEIHCSIWVAATDGRELEIVPPSLEDLSSPPKPKKVTLENALVTGCELGQEGTHVIVIGFVYRVRLEGSEESMIGTEAFRDVFFQFADPRAELLSRVYNRMAKKKFARLIRESR